MQYLKLSFKNAGFFESEKKNIKQNVSISVNQISNMLHVLMGERPVPSYRKDIKIHFNIVDEIRTLAENSFIRIDSPMVLQFGKTNYHNKNFYNREFIQTNKNAWDSYRDMERCYISWDMLEKYLGEELYNELKLYFIEQVGELNDRQALEVINEIIELNKTNETVLDIQKTIEEYDAKRLMFYKEKKKVEKDEKVSFTSLAKNLDESTKFNLICKKLVKNGKTPIVKLLFGWTSSTAINYGKNVFITLTNIRGIEPNLRKIEGSIIVPVEEHHVEKIKNSKGMARLLDGGFVWIEDLINDYEFGVSDLNDYLPINELEEYENNN